jgi:hypothetical protein
MIVHALWDVGKGISRHALNFKAINRNAECCKQSAMSSKPTSEMRFPDKSSDEKVAVILCWELHS